MYRSTLSELPRELLELIVEFEVRDRGDRAMLNHTCKFFLSLCRREEYERRIPLSRFIHTEPLLIWAYENNASPVNVAEIAIWLQYINVIQLIVVDNDVDTNFLVMRAAKSNRVFILEWLLSRDIDWNKKIAVYYAASNGNMTILQLLLDNGGVLSSEAMSMAAGNNQLDMVKWLISKGCPWDASACSNAASKGHLEMLKWLRTNGCPWNAAVFKSACVGNYREIVDYYLAETR